MKKNFLVYLFTFVLIGCTNKPIVESSTKSQLELREMQSQKIFNTDVKFITKKQCYRYYKMMNLL